MSVLFFLKVHGDAHTELCGELLLELWLLVPTPTTPGQGRTWHLLHLRSGLLKNALCTWYNFCRLLIIANHGYSKAPWQAILIHYQQTFLKLGKWKWRLLIWICFMPVCCKCVYCTLITKIHTINVPKLCLWTHKTVGWMTKVCLLFHRTKSCQGLSNGLFISSKTNPLGRRTWFTRVRPNVQMVANWNGVI